MQEGIFKRIIDKQQENRDLLVDELADHMDSDNLTKSDKIEFIKI